jgi:ABC-type sugar transport system substrate-binding protein
MTNRVQRRRILHGALIAGAGFTSTGLLASQSSPAAAAEGPSGKMASTTGMKVGVVVETLSHPLIKYWGDECARQGQGFGMDVSVQDGERNVQKQTSQMEAFVSQKVNFLVLQATDAAGLTPVVRKAEKAGIPVITLNQDVAGVHTGFVGMGHYAMGVDVAEGMAQQLNKKGSIVVIEGVQGTGANIQRMAGFKDTLKKYPDMKIVADQSAAFDRKKGHDVFQTIMQGQKEIDAVFGVNDEMAIGAAQAAVEAGRRGNIKFWGADGELDFFKAIKSGLCDGVSAIAASAVPDTVMFLGAWLMTAGVKGGQYAGRIELPPYNVTRENLDQVPWPAA